MNRKDTIEREAQEIIQEDRKSGMSGTEFSKFVEEMSNVRLWYTTYVYR